MSHPSTAQTACPIWLYEVLFLKLTWATEGIIKFPFLWYFCDFNKRAKTLFNSELLTTGWDKNFKNPLVGPIYIQISFQTMPHMTKAG